MSDTPMKDRLARDACDDTGALCRPELLWDAIDKLELELAAMTHALGERTHEREYLESALAAMTQERDKWKEAFSRECKITRETIGMQSED